MSFLRRPFGGKADDGCDDRRVATRPAGAARHDGLLEAPLSRLATEFVESWAFEWAGTRLKDDAYRDHVLAYVEKEDTPRPHVFQLGLLGEVGFAQVDALHKNVCFATYGAAKS